MEHDVMFSGSGGQGVKLAAELLCHAGNEEGKFVLELSLYASEMRGGSIESTVVISDQEVGTPIREHPSALIAMNQRGLDVYGDTVRPGGLLLINSSQAKLRQPRDDVKVVEVPATALADQVGNEKALSMVALGAYLALTGVVSVESATSTLKEVLPPYRHNTIPVNQRALLAGAEYVKEKQPLGA